MIIPFLVFWFLIFFAREELGSHDFEMICEYPRGMTVYILSRS